MITLLTPAEDFKSQKALWSGSNKTDL